MLVDVLNGLGLFWLSAYEAALEIFVTDKSALALMILLKPTV